MKVFQIILLSYFIGCISSAYFIGKVFKNIDIRGHGSGNAGATNALRVMGLKLGALTFLLDILKGVLAVTIGRSIMGYNGGIIAGIFAVIGHNWPVFLKFKGGKGVATSIGSLLMLNWATLLLSALIGILVVIKTRYVSLGSMVFLLSTPLVYILVGKPLNVEFLLLTMFLGVLSLLRHKENIVRLREGRENKIGR